MRQETALSILKTGRNVYLTGAAGTGKTYVLNQYIEYLRSHNVRIGVTASTGIAATHIGGMTIHSWAGIGIKEYLSEWDLDTLSQRQSLVKRITETSVLIIDEVSMLKPEILDMVDQVARFIRREPSPFGGMQIIFSGDFFQLPPVTRGRQESDESVFAYTSGAWHDAHIRTCYLTEQFRQRDNELSDILNDIRDGALTKKSRDALETRMRPADTHLDGAVVLHTHNDDVDAFNAKKLAEIPGEEIVYEMVSSGRKNVTDSLRRSVLAPEELSLKIGARVMFVKNSPEQAYANGTLGEITSLSGEYPVVTTLDGREIIAHPVAWEVIDDGKVLGSVAQVPLRLAWSITVHKSQGMSLDRVEIDLSRAFTPGQGYVALSRARELDGLILHGLNKTALDMHPAVVAYDEVFQSESQKWQQVFEDFSADKVRKLQEDFIANVAREGAVEEDVALPTHLRTLQLLEAQKTLEEITQERSLTLGTVLGHLEKLMSEGYGDSFGYLELPSEDMEVIADAFMTLNTRALKPVHKKLKEAYTYEQIRLARLFVERYYTDL